MLASLAGAGPSWLPLAALLLLFILSPFIVETALTAAQPRRAWLAVGDVLRRRWFEASLGAIALAALGVRLVGVGVGLGHERIDIDEHALATSVLEFFRTGSLVHATSEDHPGLHFWLIAAGGLGTYLWALMTGLVRSVDDVRPELFLWAGRTVNAVLAGGTVVLTGLVGRVVASPAAGLIAAGAVAVSPLALETSSVLRNDVGMTFFVMVSAYAAQAVCSNPSRSSASAAGALAGVAAGVKITAVFALLPVSLAAALAVTGRQRWKNIAWCVAGFVAAVAVTNHFIWSDFSNFVRQISVDHGHVRRGHFAFTDTPRWSYVSLLGEYAVGWPTMVLAAGFAVYRLAAYDRRVWVLLAFPVPYLWFMTLKSAMFPRWVYVLVPFVAVAGAAGLLGFSQFLTRLPGRFLQTRGAAAAGRLLGAGIVLASLLPVAWPGAADISRRFTAPTYSLAEAWLAANVPPEDRVLLETGWLDLEGSGLRVVRVGDLRKELVGDDFRLQECRWIVVSEPAFDIPGLSRLFLVKQFVAAYGFGGNRGIDVRVYVRRPLEEQPGQAQTTDTPARFGLRLSVE